MAIGALPLSGFLKGLVDLNERGEVKVEPQTGQTSCQGIFAAGDLTDGPYKQIITAASDGCKAALSVYHYLHSI